MIYKHQYFTLDNESKKVFDENIKELHLTGNAYRVLVFLCDKKNATITEIGDYLDWAKNYDENHIRQYRYKINTLIGHDIIVYQNGIYSLSGEAKPADESNINGRNTDLLQSSSIKSNTEVKNMITDEVKNPEFNKLPAILSSVLLLLAILDWPYGYYTLLRIIITAVSAYYSYYLYENKLAETLKFWFWGLIFIAILFNPILPIYLDRKTWGFIDILTTIFFISFIYNKKLININ